MKNRCMYLGKQVHPFDKTGACIWVIRCTRFPLRRICNPTASSISICNALINNQETKNIFTHLKCLYSLRLDCKSNRARDSKEQKEQKEQKKTRKSFLRTCAYTYAGKISKKLLLLLLQCY